MKTILIYGFKPYRGQKENITEKIIQKIKRKDISKVIFPAKFNKKIFLDKIRKTNPNIIIGLGQCSKGKKIRIERKAVNKKKLDKKGRAKIILKRKPISYLTNFKLKTDKSSRISYDAGENVCNFSMYIILDYIQNKNIKFVFFHIPANYGVKKAVSFVRQFLKKTTKL